MSNVKGRFGVEVQFNDSTTIGGAKSLKSIALQHSTEYDFGKIAVVTGTVGTAAVSVAVNPTTYRNSAGDVVSFGTVSRVAFSASAPGQVRLSGTGVFDIYSRAGQVAVSETSEAATFEVSTTAGTSAFTLVMYGA
jgi:hypothetical protein